MNALTRTILATGIAALIGASLPAQAQDAEEAEPSMIYDTRISIKPGHMRQFARGMAAWKECYLEHGGEDTWSIWRDRESSAVHWVSSMAGWADLGEDDAAGEACVSIVEMELAPHVTEVQSRFARSMPAWNRADEDDEVMNNVVRLHQFRVEDGDAFREAVSNMVAIWKEADFEHMPYWYDVIGNNAGEAGYFAAVGWENFAAMDEDRTSGNDVLVEAVGEEQAEAMWDAMRDALHDDWEYSTVLLSRMTELSHSEDDE